MTLEEMEFEVKKRYDRYVSATQAAGIPAPAGYGAEARRMDAWREYERLRDEYIARAKEAGVFEGPTPIKLRKKYR